MRARGEAVVPVIFRNLLPCLEPARVPRRGNPSHPGVNSVGIHVTDLGGTANLAVFGGNLAADDKFHGNKIPWFALRTSFMETKFRDLRGNLSFVSRNFVVSAGATIL